MTARRLMPIFKSLSLTLLVCFCFCCDLKAQDSEGEAMDVAALILELDDVDPKVRSNAEAAILKLGAKAIPALKEGMKKSNLEANRRCVILFEKIELERRRQIAEVFLAEDVDEKELLRFKAWSSFSKFAKSDEVATRKLFLNMCDQIPLAFEDYDIHGDHTASATKELARLILIPNKHPRARSESLVLAYVFLVQQAKEMLTDPNEQLFSEVEVLEAVSFFSSNAHASSGRNHPSRKVIDRVVANWLNANGPFESPFDPSRLRLIFHTSNFDLIAGLEKEYESMKPGTKLKYLDIVAKASRSKDKSSLKKAWELLQKPLVDETVVASSRFRSRPAEKVEVTLELLSKSLLADLLRTSGENAKPIELDTVFGAYPLSFLQFSIIKKQIDSQSLSSRLQARIEESGEIE